MVSLSNEEKLRAGARNLLVDYVGVQAGEDVLIVQESRETGYYDDVAPNRVAEEARALGANVHLLRTPVIEGPEHIPAFLSAAMRNGDHTILFSRIGDMVRFGALPVGGTITMSYALDAEFLASDFCNLPFGLINSIRERVQADLDQAKEWRLTCPLGSDVSSRIDPNQYQSKKGFSLRLFPMGTFRPLPSSAMSGQLVTSWFPASASHRYQPYGLALDQPVIAKIENGRILDFGGDGQTVVQIRNHYEHVGGLFETDPFVIESWHAGLHPKSFFPRPARENIERWGGIMWSCPRYAHFHSCGFNPGEILLSIIDPTIYVDGEAYWENGKLKLLEREDLQALLDDYPGWEHAFESPGEIGL